MTSLGHILQYIYVGFYRRHKQIYQIIRSRFYRVHCAFIWVKIQFRYMFRLFMKPSSGDIFYIHNTVYIINNLRKTIPKIESLA
jgi:hypothetical protein